jgi:hypothetical protein
MTPNHYAIITECVDIGTRRGVQRAFKHTDDPSLDQIEQAVHDAVMLEICEKYYFTAPKEETIEFSEL